MDVSELRNDSSSKSVRIQFPNVEILKDRLLTCYNCKEGLSEENLVNPCKCAYKFIHVHCLEMLANAQKKLHCPCCHTRYPLEKQHKSMLKMLQEVCVFFSKILFLCVGNVLMISLIIFTLSLYDVWNFEVIVIEITSLSILLWLIYLSRNMIIDWNRKIYHLYCHWYKSTQEWKLKKGYNTLNFNIQNTEV